MCIEKENGDMFWTNAVNLEMSNVEIPFEVSKKGQHARPRWRKSSGHIISNVEIDFTWKARWVKDGHRTPNPITSSYACAVSKEGV